MLFVILDQFLYLVLQLLLGKHPSIKPLEIGSSRTHDGLHGTLWAWDTTTRLLVVDSRRVVLVDTTWALVTYLPTEI